MLAKVYSDGGHYIAVPAMAKLAAYSRNRFYSKTAKDYMFDSAYFDAIKWGLKDRERVAYIKSVLMTEYPDDGTLDGYIECKSKLKINNYFKRRKRFKRKAYLNDWNFFVTFTYDERKQTAESFRRKLRRCLSNLHTRRGWRYMGVFERGKDSDRLHFHALLYVPEGQMVGALEEVKDYDTRNHKMQVTYRNSFFFNAFGRNDFEPLEREALKSGHTINYLLKYLGKTGERITYSRGIPAEMVTEIDERDVVTELKDFVMKYVLFDDIFDDEMIDNNSDPLEDDSGILRC